MSGLGTYTAALAIGGIPNVAITEDWNGVSWQETSDLNTGVEELGSTGTTPAGLKFGGSPHSAAVEEWSGTSTTTKVLTD